MRASIVFLYYRAQRLPQSLFPSPLWGGVRGGGEPHDGSSLPLSPPSPTRGEGVRERRSRLYNATTSRFRIAPLRGSSGTTCE
ncbi:hypothetical protein SAMN05444170_4129 [Bradyrhizobium erythrophlei]|uniref:Uncharacterized protein n=1 Tax=Bradyrhizobium erythrophlei TaxID=1437360 RepID=A0A1M7U9R2_9BRAD|nr:hypothetical protein SAMN05444170_4129 [Bradyrhizobium erythrophlei]